MCIVLYRLIVRVCFECALCTYFATAVDLIPYPCWAVVCKNFFVCLAMQMYCPCTPHNHSTPSTQSLHPLHTYTPLGPDTASRVFSSTLVRNSQPTIPGRSKEKEGAIFVLTCGRGLIDLRSGIKTNVLFPTARTSSVSQETKGCMLAYELEQ